MFEVQGIDKGSKEMNNLRNYFTDNKTEIKDYFEIDKTALEDILLEGEFQYDYAAGRKIKLDHETIREIIKAIMSRDLIILK